MSAPLVPEAGQGSANRLLRLLADGVIRLSLLVSPRPAALLIRRAFAAGGAEFKRSLDRHAPAGIVAQFDQRYGEEPDARLDVFYPEGTTDALALLLWVHGGGWVGGSKNELTGYFKILAREGLAVAAADYSRAPEHRYPTPLRQMMRALEMLQANAERYHVDPRRIVIGGDSAGAQIAAQLAALVTTPGYARKVGVAPTITPEQLRAVVLACGAYDRTLAGQASSAAARRFIKALTWAYTGERHFLTDARSRNWSVTDNLTRAFPPALITVGNADPLRPHSELLAARLDALGVSAETVFFSPQHKPALEHEYQFNLDLAEARQFLARQREFLRRRVSAARP